MVQRAKELCEADGMATAVGGEVGEVKAGAALFFRSTRLDGSIETRSIHTSCPNTGDKWVLSKFFRVRPLKSTLD